MEEAIEVIIVVSSFFFLQNNKVSMYYLISHCSSIIRKLIFRFDLI